MKSHLSFRSILQPLVVAILSTWFSLPLALRGNALDPSQPITQYGHDVWDEDRGLPQNSVTGIAQTPDGYLWLATQEGVARFDGVSFSVHDRANTPAISYNNITKLFAASDSTLWIGTEASGLLTMKGGVFTKVGADTKELSDRILSIAEGADHTIWIGTWSHGLIAIRDGKIKLYGEADGFAYKSVTALHVDPAGTVWIGTGHGLVRYSNHAFESPELWNGMPQTTVTAIQTSRDNALWLGFSQAGLFRFANEAATPFAACSGIGSNTISTIVQDETGSVWIGSEGGGISRYSNGTFSCYTHHDGLSNDFVTALFLDREGSLWVGTDGGGLNRFKETKFHSYGALEGMNGDFAVAPVESWDGSIWAGSTGAGINHFAKGKFTSYTTKNGLSSNLIYSLYEDNQHILWIGTSDRGLNRFDGKRFVSFDTSDGLLGNTISAITGDGQGGLWVGTRMGLNHYLNGKFTKLTTYDGLPSNYVSCLLPANNGGLFVGTPGGIALLYNGKFRKVTPDTLGATAIFSMYEDAAGTLWVGSSMGLLRLNNGILERFGTAQGLSDDVIFSAIEDGVGNLWMSSNRGVFRVAKQELEAVADHRLASVTSHIFGRPDGMRSRECNGGFQPPVLRARDGKLWYPTVRGLAVVDPQRLGTNPFAPIVSVDKFIVDNETIQSGNGTAATLSPGKGWYEFHYAGLSFTAPEFVKFKYMLEGYDKGWVDAGTRRVAYYTNLAPGTYRFKVMAANCDGVWNNSPAECSFVLSPYYYQSPFFIGLCIGGVLFSGIGVHKLRIRHVRSKELERLVEQRTRALREEKERTEDALEEIRAAQVTIREQAMLLDKAQEAIYMQGFDGAIHFWNRGAERVYGWNGDEVREKNIDIILFRDGKTPSLLRDAYAAIYSKGEWNGELNHRAKDGRTIVVESHWTLIRDDDGNAKGILVINSDITEKKHIEVQFLRAQRMQSIGTLAGGIAHDLNNVLAPIMLSIELLRTKVTDDLGTRAIQTISSSAARGAGIVKQVLAFSRGVEGERGAVQVKYVVSELEKMLRDTFPRSIRIFSDMPADLWQVSGDPTQIYQVLMNFAVNARDAMPDGGDLRISSENRVIDEHYVRTHTDATAGNFVTLAVSDTGMGMSREVMDKIFEPFFTTKDIGKGTGLGLSTVAGIVKSHGGFVNVYSEPGKGTRFEVSMPALDDGKGAAGKVHERSALPRGNDEIILVVDDEDAVREMTMSILTSHGYRVLDAVDGRQAIEHLKQHRDIALVITDMMMPNMDGKTTIRKLTEIDPNMRFIAVSGLMGDQKVAEVAQLGNVSFLQKPFTTDRLLRTLHEVLHAEDIARGLRT